MPIYMNYDSLSIKGAVTEENHKEWIELSSFQFGVGRGISSSVGGSKNREASAPSVSEIKTSKAQDDASIELLKAALVGEGVKVIIDFCKTDRGNLEAYLTYTLTNCMISSYSSSSTGDRPTESLSLSFTRIEVKNTPMDESGETGSPTTVTYDLTTAKIV